MGVANTKPAAVERKKLADLQASVEVEIIGQKALVESMLICLLCDGHMLIEGMPGLAKTPKQPRQEHWPKV